MAHRSPLRSYSRDMTDVGIRGVATGYGQTNDGLLYGAPYFTAPSSYNRVTGVVTAGITKRRMGLYVDRITVEPDAATVAVAGYRHHNDTWVAGQWDDAATPAFTDDTIDAQDFLDDDGFDQGPGTPGDNDGWVIGSKYPFDWVSVFIGANSVGTADQETSYSTQALTTGIPAWTVVVDPPWHTIADQFTIQAALTGIVFKDCQSVYRVSGCN